MDTKRQEMTDETKTIILELFDSGFKQSEISKVLKISPVTICRFLKRYHESGSIENRPRSGRPKKMDDRSCRTLNRIIRGNRTSTLVDITNEFNTFNHVSVSKRTITRSIHKYDLRKRAIAKKLGVRQINRVRRVSWARSKLTWTVAENWSKIIFSDEMAVTVSGCGAVKVWRTEREKCLPECIGHLKCHTGRNLKVMVWGCITYHGQGLLTFIDGTMDSKKYINALDENLWPVIAKYFSNKPYMFQDDNAPPHASRMTKAWKENNNIPTLTWPAQSPDVNIIENIWLLLKNQVKRHMMNIDTVDDLKAVLQHAWLSIPLMYIQNLYSSIPRRLQLVIRSKGHITKY